MDDVIPQDIESEVCTIGAMLLDSSCIPAVTRTAGQQKFFRPAHQVCFQAMVEMYEAGTPIDLVTVSRELLARGQLKQIGGKEYLYDLADGVPSAYNAEHYAQCVHSAWLRREAIRVSNAIRQEAMTGRESPQELLVSWQQRINELALTDGQPVELVSLTEPVISSAQHRSQGLALGIPSLDFLTGGLRPGNYMILAARPKRGKTTLACYIALHVAGRMQPVLFVSREMTETEITERMMCSEARVQALKLRKGECGDDEVESLRGIKKLLDRLPIRILRSADSVGAIRAEIRAYRQEKHGIGLVIIDYFQLLRGPGRSRYEQFSEISRGLKTMFLEEEVSGLVVSQLRRPQNPDKPTRPHMSELKETGSLEQDADQMLLLYNNAPVDFAGSNEIWAELINRHGPGVAWPDVCGASGIRLKWQPRFARMEPIEWAPA